MIVMKTCIKFLLLAVGASLAFSSCTLFSKKSRVHRSEVIEQQSAAGEQSSSGNDGGRRTIDLGVWQDETGKTYSVDHIKAWMQPFYDAGIRNFYICTSVDMIKRYVEAAQSMPGAKIHAWIFSLNACNDTDLYVHKDWFDVNRKGENSLDNPPYTKIYRWLSPSVPAVRDWLKRKADSYASIPGLASVHLDFIRYNDRFLGRYSQEHYFHIDQTDIAPEYDFGYHPKAIEKFKQKFGYSPLDLSAPGLSPEWNQFRMDEVTSLVNEVVDEVHKRNVQVTAAVFPFPERARMMVLQNWPTWNVDAVLAMNYQHFYKERLDWNRFSVEAGLEETRHHNRYIAGIFVGNLNASEIYQVAKMDIEAGADGISFFSANPLKKDGKLETVRRIYDEFCK